MKPHLSALSLVGLLTLSACDSDGSDPGEGALQLYTTCGDPACGGYNAAAHSNPPCTTQAEGDACTREATGCDLTDSCNAELICAWEDPKAGEGGCPISLRAAKTRIRYLSGTDTRALHEELMSVRLASYRYKVEPETAPDHLGFIIDDQRSDTPMVMSSGGRVDLYGYTSMAVAALQVQEAALLEQQARIAAQEARIADLEARIAAMEAATR